MLGKTFLLWAILKVPGDEREWHTVSSPAHSEPMELLTVQHPGAVWLPRGPRSEEYSFRLSVSPQSGQTRFRALCLPGANRLGLYVTSFPGVQLSFCVNPMSARAHAWWTTRMFLFLCLPRLLFPESPWGDLGLMWVRFCLGAGQHTRGEKAGGLKGPVR